MSQEAERVYTINLGKVWLSPNNQRAKRAINMIKEFAEHHMKTEQIKIDQELSQQVWKRGIRSPPRKIRVRMSKTEDGYVMVSPYEDDVKPKEEKTKKSDKKAESKEEAKPEAKEAAAEKPEAKKPEPKKPEPKKAEKPEPKEKKADAKKSAKPAKKSK
ncbi:MAG: 50S ribosomal protein L31 [Candidatus Nitrosotenuis sp.]|nr:MAG: 50S ribosomal protein L31 [Candidatus Nitrosotenuis sp.]